MLSKNMISHLSSFLQIIIIVFLPVANMLMIYELHRIDSRISWKGIILQMSFTVIIFNEGLIGYTFEHKSVVDQIRVISLAIFTKI